MTQHDDVVGERPHHFQIVADEEISELVALLQIAQEIDDLRLHRHVERGGRLIQDQELRLEHERTGNGDALALAAGEFMRVAVLRRRIESDLLQRLRHPRAPLGAIHVRLLDEQALLDDLRDRQARRERAVRILEHDLHVAAERPHLL